jgi:hypothetical protein
MQAQWREIEAYLGQEIAGLWRLIEQVERHAEAVNQDGAEPEMERDRRG